MTSAESSEESRTVEGEVLPPTSAAKINLSNAESIRQEMARVYREARAGNLDTSEAGRLIYMLSQITKAHELGVVEKRLAELEQVAEQRKLPK